MLGKGCRSALMFNVFMRTRRKKNKQHATSDMFLFGILTNANAVFRRKKLHGYKTEACIKT